MRTQAASKGAHALRWRNILVPVDCSAFSREAVQRAVELAGPQDRITLLHVIDFSSLVPQVGPPEWTKILEDAQKNAAEFFTRTLNDFGTRVHFETAVVQGRAHEEILEYGARHGTDLIVLGLKPHHWFQWFRRQTARRVLSAVTCETTVIPLNLARPSRPKGSSHLWVSQAPARS
jgi:nucleotide-binding universal stress UspA family protein